MSCPEAIDPCPPVLLDVAPDHVGRADVNAGFYFKPP
jgi:hypothetical protein